MLRPFLWILVLILGFFSAVPAYAASQKPGTHRYQIKISSKQRKYLVHVPGSYSGQVLPAIIVLHGGLCNGWIADWDSRLTQKADRDGFFVIYPFGSKGIGSHLLTWNAGTCCGPAATSNVDDISFIRELIKKLEVDYNIDRDRVFVSGISNGGMMAYRIACELPDLVAAIAPVEACMVCKGITGTTPVSVVAFNGKADHVVPFAGGVGSFCGYRIKCPPAEDTIKTWAEHNRCQSVPERVEIGNVVKETYSGGQDGAEVCLYTLETGHVWPGGRSDSMLRLTGGNPDFSATEAMCDFSGNIQREVQQQQVLAPLPDLPASWVTEESCTV